MICPKVLILTLFIVGTFAKDTIKDMEERIEELEKKLAADEEKDIETNKQLKAIEKKLASLAKAHVKDDIETNKKFKVIKKKVNEHSTLIQANTDVLEVRNPKINLV